MKVFILFALALFAITSRGAADPAVSPRLVAVVPTTGVPEGAQAYRVADH